MTSRANFGRRGESVKTSPATNKRDDGAGNEQSDAIRKVLWAAPLIVVLVAVPVIVAKLANHGVGVDFGAKPAAQRGVLDIDWCQAGRAAVEGAARGFAGGAGARGGGTGAR
jgi:hypothetical protein